MKKLTILLLATIISCNSVAKKENKPEQKHEIATLQKGLPLNSQWILEQFDNVDFKEITKDSYITINDDLQKFSGKGGCNNIGGSLIIKGNTIKFDKVFSTRMFCENTMKQEDLFLKNLNQTNNFKIVGGELFLYNNKELLMTLESFRN